MNYESINEIMKKCRKEKRKYRIEYLYKKYITNELVENIILVMHLILMVSFLYALSLGSL